MKFEFDTTTDGAAEAAALATALAIIHGDAITSALDKALDKIEITGSSLASDGYADSVWAKAAGEVGIVVENSAPVTVDTAGLPWHERIHASTKTTNKDGTWSRRRNTPDATFDKVMAELIAARDGAEEASAADAFADPTPLEEPAAQDTGGSSTDAASAGQTAPIVASPSNVVPPPPPSGDVPQPPAPAGTTVSFPQLMVKITKAQTAGKIDKATVNGFLATFELAKMSDLNSAGTDTIQAINAMVDEHVGQ
jgi:hypothetical protein